MYTHISITNKYQNSNQTKTEFYQNTKKKIQTEPKNKNHTKIASSGILLHLGKSRAHQSNQTKPTKKTHSIIKIKISNIFLFIFCSNSFAPIHSVVSLFFISFCVHDRALSLFHFSFPFPFSFLSFVIVVVVVDFLVLQPQSISHL